MRFEVGIGPQSLLYEFQNELWIIHVQMGVPEAIGSDVPNFPKRVLRGRLATDHFLMGSQTKLWTLGDKMGIMEATRWDVPNLTKDVPNFYQML